MLLPLISLLHPTARIVPSEAFPRGWKDAHDAWMERADHPERIEYILAVHQSRWSDANEQESVPGVMRVQNSRRDCVVDQLNVAAEASHGTLLVGVMDDLYPPEHWDTRLLESWSIHATNLADSPAIIVCSSGATPDRDWELMICGAMTRARYEQQGYVLNPAFESMFADNYFAWEARRDASAGKVHIIGRMDIQFDHRHPIFGTQQMDDVYRQQNREAAYRQGYATFARLTKGTKVLACCFPGELFRAQWVWSAFDILSYLNGGERFIVARFGGHTSNVYCTRIELAQAVNEGAPQADFVLWLDDDNILLPAQFDMLYQDLLDHPELDGVVGWCWCDNDGEPGPDGKPKPWMMSVGRQGEKFACRKLSREDFLRAVRSGKMLITSDDLEPDAFWSGFPVVLLRGESMRSLGAQAFAPILNPIVKYGFTGEDTSFFYNARQAGMKFAVDLRVKVPHVKVRAIEPAYVPESERTQAAQDKANFSAFAEVG